MKLSDLILVSMIDKFRLWTIAGEEAGKVNHNGATATTKEILTYKDYEVDHFSVDYDGKDLIIDVYIKQKCVGYRPYKPRYVPGLTPIDNNDSITLSPKIDCDVPKGGELRTPNSGPATTYYGPGHRGFAK